LNASARGIPLCAAAGSGYRSVAYTYNDTVIFSEYATDVARAMRASHEPSLSLTPGFSGRKYIAPGGYTHLSLNVFPALNHLILLIRHKLQELLVLRRPLLSRFE
jgi:hypothetical protein